MPKVENDPTKTMAKPFVIIAGPRSGGTFLAHALSNHPDVFCDRGEPLHELSIWHRRTAYTKSYDTDLVFMLTHQEGYKASGFRMLYAQAFKSHIWSELERMKPRAIFLSRRNILRQAASMLHNRLVRGSSAPYHPNHSLTPPDAPAPIRVNPGDVIRTCSDLTQDYIKTRDILRASSLNVLDVYYTDLIGYEGNQATAVEPQAAANICGFLEIPIWYLTCGLSKIHPYPLKALFLNWQNVEIAVANSQFARYLEHEDEWYEANGKWSIKQHD